MRSPQVGGAVASANGAAVDAVRWQGDLRSDCEVRRVGKPSCRPRWSPTSTTPVMTSGTGSSYRHRDAATGAIARSVATSAPSPVHTLRVTTTPPSPSGFRARAVDHLALAIGTTKGLFIVSDGVLDGPMFPGEAIYSFAQLPDRYITGAESTHFGPSVRSSQDAGLTWDEPERRPIAFPDDTEAALAAVWQLHPDRRPATATRSGRAWSRRRCFGPTIGVRPSSSSEGCTTTPTVRPGSRDSGLALHTVITQPERPDRITVAVSAGGVYRSDDGGETFHACNVGIEARFLPDPHPDHGQCVHKVAVDEGDPDTFWAQNHFGIYRSTDAGDHWENVGQPGTASGVPADFGFAVVTHPVDADTAFVFPLESDAQRWGPGARSRVYRTSDAGVTWEPCARGLPAGDTYLTVLRDSFAISPVPPYTLAFGTRSGHVFASVDNGDSWRQVAEYLPGVTCVRVLD